VVEIPEFCWEMISTVWFSSERLPPQTLNITQNVLGVKKLPLMFRPIFFSVISFYFSSLYFPNLSEFFISEAF